MTGETPPADAPQEYTGPVVAIPVYAGVSELELGVMVSVLRLCGGEGCVRTVNRSRASIVTAGGLVSTPHVLFAALPEPAALLIPGGPGAAKAARDPLLQGFLRAHAALTTGTGGSGLLLPGEAGTLDGRVVGGPAELADTLWGFTPADVRPGEVVTDGALCSAPAGFAALHAALHVASALWGEQAARDAAARLGGSPLLG
ncbi:transcriptional regulator [Deinococcus soli (ex Cha et al. 2016)]|uniref:Transcriptional regulator n=1 Tax=Deinococcus soli (ex Cha et al. 2016) TaxID=1309411 RepID=A0A0F7JS85_9DEIO|nr:transcriptional regulator [Deinococcus soli (ex Cha et al. 2016)]AKH18219.1 transcriptional regulator [Deinococcus soli (ex Cha et al. 2016)]